MTGQWHNRGRVLVVGTTDDYIDWIRRACPGQAVFLTSVPVRRISSFETPRSKEEILTDLDDGDRARADVANHLDRFGIKLSGITCFDCERLGLAADLAKAFGLSFPSRAAVEKARDKFRSKEIWQSMGISCPKVTCINSLEDALGFMKGAGHAMVLKPVAGSGSELIFKCRTDKDCARGFETIRDGLAGRSENPLFYSGRKDLMLAEEMIEGPEFSADFIIEPDRADIIRVCRKIKYRSHPFGTIAGYQLLSDPSASLDMADLQKTLFQGATSLGITRGICMADFIRNSRRRNVLVELTPRPGGDCLPQLIREGMGVDMLALALDVARDIPRQVNGGHPAGQLIGVRIFAPRSGMLRQVDTCAVAEDPRVTSVVINRSVGHVVTLPPEDYDSWILGYMILAPDGRGYPEAQAQVMSSRIQIEMS